ncbi:RanBP1 domain-containing protein [Suillus cothurnatus]|nr:RanBP1 domain-containing protein [Suillus cothurnatus]
MRAKLFRFDNGLNEWKDRGIGDVKFLQHKETKKVRLVMRHDKTLKVCAHHHISAEMRLQPNIGSDRSWVWKVAADYTEEPPTAETLSIRFANSDNANEFKHQFELTQKMNRQSTAFSLASASELHGGDPHFEPVIKLTEQVEVKTYEEDEDVLFKMRAKLFRFDNGLNEWKDRGIGDVKFLQHKETKEVRLVMKRDKTLKVCANHHISAEMRLQPNIGSDRSWVWKVAADYSEEPPTAETLAIRFANSDNANEFKRQFELTQKIIRQSTARSLASASELHDEDSFVICTIDSNNLRRFPSSHDPLDISPLPPTRDYRIWVDASTDTGIGLLWNDRWAFWRTATDLCGPLQTLFCLRLRRSNWPFV